MSLAGRIGYGVLILGLLILPLGFVFHALEFGFRGLTTDIRAETYLYRPTQPTANVAIFAHMLAGAAMTLLAPVQLIPWIRRRIPRLHRISGYVLVTACLVGGIGGLTYIAIRGTIGGPLMNVGFALYGGLVILCALRTVQFARALDLATHRIWAIRLVILAMGSWIYRMHYTLWYIATDGLASSQDFSGLFDQIQVFAFYLPYLAVFELSRRMSSARRSRESV